MPLFATQKANFYLSHPFGFVGAVLHPYETTQYQHFMGSHAKIAMTVYPLICMGLTPGGFFVYTAKPFRDYPLLFLLFVPYRTFGPVHPLIRTDHPVIGPVQETDEK